MTPVSIGLTLLGILAIFWPFATLFCKRNVLNAQWLMMLALTFVSFTFFLLGALFNTFLKDEYLLLILFIDVVLVTPPLIHVALSVLTQPHSPSPSVRAIFLPSLLTIALIILSLLVAGPDTYRLWTSRSAQGIPFMLYPGSWRYNLIVIANFYLFWLTFISESIFIFISGTRQYIRFNRLNDEYFPSHHFHQLNLKKIFIAANTGWLIVLISAFTKPFSDDHLLLFFLTYCLPLAAILFYVGHAIYSINNSAERLRPHNPRPRDPSSLAPILTRYIEQQQAFLNPDLSVFLLAEQLHTSEDLIIDAIHYSHGIPFGQYIDSLRIQHAISLILSQHPDIHNPDSLPRIAHQSGFLSSNDFLNAWTRFTHSQFGKSSIFD